MSDAMAETLDQLDVLEARQDATEAVLEAILSELRAERTV